MDREPRLPLFVRVQTRPELLECWSQNLSGSGMGLTALLPAHTALSTGAEMELSFALPDVRDQVRARATVAWVEARSGRGLRDRVAFGVTFTEVGSADRVALTRYLAEYRPTVAVVGASASEAATCRAALEPDVALLFPPDREEVEAVLARGDVRAVVLLGEEGEAIEWVDRLSVQRKGPVELGPRVVYAARSTPARVLRLLGEGRVFQSVPDLAPAWLRLAVVRACEDYALRSDLRRLSAESRRTTLPGPAALAALPRELVVESAPMRAVLELLRTVAPHKAHVLLQGETGTGKELLARSLHALSDRAAGPFVALDCGALTETLLESELFGHVAGAFTGAIADRPGLFHLAEGGTLFLDEIENTTPALQSKLLRALDSGEVRPVGGSLVRRIDVRLVAATNRSLEAEVDSGRFRADLFYRLNAFPIEVPPLRDRREDVLPLARAFLARACEQFGRPPSKLSRPVEGALLRHRWPGNVRELRNAIERAVLLTPPGAAIALAALPPRLATAGGSTVALTLRERVAAFEREAIRAALAEHGGVIRQAAAALGLPAVTLGRRVKRYRVG